MTEKRFKLSEPNGAYLIDGDKPLFHMNDSDDEIVELLNSLSEENEQLKTENKNLKSNIDDLLNQELDERDIVCQAGKFRLEEWGKHRYHQFYNGDESLEDESVVIMLMEQSKENEQLKKLAYGNEEQLLTVMTYLHDNHYEIWEEVNKECFE